MRLFIAFLFPLVLAAQREPLKFEVNWVNVPRAPPRGVQHHTLRSAAMNQEVGFNVYLPSEYASSPGKRDPVIYWLHGSGGNESQGLAQAVAFDAAIATGQVPPAIMVFANGASKSEYRDWHLWFSQTRLKFLFLAARIWRHAGRVGVSYSDHYPEQGLFERLMNRLRTIAATEKGFAPVIAVALRC